MQAGNMKILCKIRSLYSTLVNTPLKNSRRHTALLNILPEPQDKSCLASAKVYGCAHQQIEK